MPLSGSHNAGDSGHLGDHNLIDTTLGQKLDGSVAASTYLSQTAASAAYARGVDADSNGVTGAGSRHTALNTLLASAATNGIEVVQLRGHSYDLSGGHVLIPAGVELRGVPGTVLTGGAFALVNDGTVADLTFGTGWSLYADLYGHWGSSSGVALIGGTVRNVTVQRAGTQVWPTRGVHNLLPRTMQKLNGSMTFKKTNVLLLADSLGFQGSGSGDAWPTLLFSSSTAATTGVNYYVGNIFGGNNTQVTDLSLPGTSPQIDAAYFAVEQNALSVGSGLDNQVKPVEGFATYPTQLADYDVAFICTGHNAASGFIGHLENVVARLRRAGIEVVLLTQSPTNPVDDNYARPLMQMRAIASAYGCAVADTYAAFMREILTGRSTALSLVADGTHPNQAGWNIYAQVVRDVLLDQQPTGASSTLLPSKRVIVSDTNSNSTDRWGNLYGVTFTATSQSAGVTTATPSDTAKSPLAGRRTSLTNAAYSVPNGEYVEFAVPDAYDVTLILEGTGSAANGSVKTNAGANTLSTFSSPTNTGQTVMVQIDSGTWNAAALKSRPIRIYSTSGTLKVIGVLWTTIGRRYQPKNTDGSYKGVALTGTWAVQAGPWYGVTNLPYTDTTGSYAEFDFVGDGVQIKVNASPASGQMRLDIDGVQGSIFGTTQSQEQILPVRSALLPYGRHKARITYTAVNGAGAADGSTPGAHRMVLYEIAALDTRMNAPLEDLTVPALVI